MIGSMYNNQKITILLRFKQRLGILGRFTGFGMWRCLELCIERPLAGGGGGGEKDF